MARRLAITVRGVVQGVGFRPFVYNLAVEQGLTGWVINQGDCVRIEVEGAGDATDSFVKRLRDDAPPQAAITHMEVQSFECVESSGGASPVFEILASRDGAQRRPTIPPDLATCRECREEIVSPDQRRYRYAFTNCTNCGPRWSIITGVPYDRPRTTMRPFAMCDACWREYRDPTDRRFHAQPIACPRCGPTLRLIDGDGQCFAQRDAALRRAAEAVRRGAILALKGLGGFQLIVDASCEEAVGRLRQRKRRPAKPLAVMLADHRAVERFCEATPFEQSQLASPPAPIMLLRRRHDAGPGGALAPNVAPGNPYLGVMLPNTPLHALLLAEVDRPVVCTSGNRSEEPMVISSSDARRRLGDIADLILTHDRGIARPVDDSVCREDDGALQVLRRARGFAPLPLPLNTAAPCILAVGGHLKNTVALSLGDEVVVGSHVGDLDNVLSLEVHRRAIADLVEFFAARPERIACDLHPDYSSSQHAEQLAASWKVPLTRVQHHHAHVLSAMVEHQLEGPVLGLAWDGTGYGPDGTIWGSEAILVDGARWQRRARLREFPLPGGDRAAREPRRAALGLLYELGGPDGARHAARWFDEADHRVLLAALGRAGLFPRTSSMGRLFDAIAALCGLGEVVSFEGEAAMALEFAADESETRHYDFHPGDGAGDPIDWRPALRQVLADRQHGTDAAVISARFHNGLALLAARVAEQVGCPQIVLTGGCFQNRLLTERVRGRLCEAGFRVYTQRRVPPGDGGLALGQILGAIHQVGV